VTDAEIVRDEIKRCWENISPHLPPSDPSDALDPSVSLDTLAAIAHAKWAKAEAAEAERDEALARLSSIGGYEGYSNAFAELERERDEALRTKESERGIMLDLRDRAEAAEDALAEALETIGIQQAEVQRLKSEISKVQPKGLDDFGRPIFDRDDCQSWFEDHYELSAKEEA
jgi:hypothetical protein